MLSVTNDTGTLNADEFHPGAIIARDYINKYLIDNFNEMNFLIESIASTALSGNRIAQLAVETLRRLRAKEPVSDRYLMGLAWFLYELGER